MATNTIPVAVLIGYFQRMLRERWVYDWSGTETGKVGCAGAFVWAFRQHGISLYNGSNRLARTQVERLIPINVANVVPGMAAFKHREPGETGYALPSGYQPGGSHYNGDLNDYYHVGLIDEDTTRVLNAQGTATGFVASLIGKGGWSHVAHLKQVDYGTTIDKEVPPMATASICAANGKAVNLRAAPSTSAARLAQLPVGTPVTVLSASGDWAQIIAGARTGYVMRQFLRGGSAASTNGSAASTNGSAASTDGSAASTNGSADTSGSSPGTADELADIRDWLGHLEQRVTALEGGHG